MPGLDFDHLFNYYMKLLELNKAEEESMWTTTNLFLVVQGILVAAISLVISIKDVGIIIAYFLSTIGLFISFMWFFLMRRKRLAIRFTTHQLVHLEQELFKDRLRDVDKIEQYFVLYNLGLKAFYSDNSEDGNDKVLENIRNHHSASRKLQGRFENRLDIIGLKARVITHWFPITFMLIWVVTLLVLTILRFNLIQS